MKAPWISKCKITTNILNNNLCVFTMSSQQFKPVQSSKKGISLTGSQSEDKYNEYLFEEIGEGSQYILPGQNVNSYLLSTATLKSGQILTDEHLSADEEDTIHEESIIEEESLAECGVGNNMDFDLLGFQSPPSTTFSELAGKMNVLPLKDKPAYRTVVQYIRSLLTELVCKNTENVLSHFEEWSLRVINKQKNTYGISQNLFLPTANNHIHTLRSFTFKWKDAIEEYIHEYGIEILGEDGLLDKLRTNMEEVGEDEVQNIEDLIIPPDDWEEGGYKHYLDRKAEPKEPPFDEFQYVTLEQMAFFDEVGIGLPKYEQYEIHMALFRLASVRQLIDVKFWGKIFGLYQDYYIAEAIMKPEDMRIDDFENLPEYEESEFVGEFCEDLLIDELSQEGPTEVELEPEEIGQIYGEECVGENEMKGEIYGEFFGEYGGETANITKFYEPPAVTFNDTEHGTDSMQIEEVIEMGEEMVGESESVFDLPIDDGSFRGKMTLKNYMLPLLPRIIVKPIKLPPMEDPGEGVNKHVFFVTNNPKSDWIRLPHVTPEQIVVARQITKCFTGYLTSRVNSYPKFPGIEMHLLRAQIARISAGTQVSPAGYYRFDEGEEAVSAIDIAAGESGKVHLNKDFEPLAVKDLTDPTCTFWVHHTEHILRQGRTVWYNVNKKEPRNGAEGNEDMEDDGEEAPPFKEEIGEKGPPLLTSCAEDLFMEVIPPWTVKPAIELAPHEGCVYVRSNLWPGSYSFAFGRKIGFMYVGWGIKAVSYGYTPPPLTQPSTEYPLEPKIIEVTDATPYQEEEYQLKVKEWQRKKEKEPTMHEGEGEERGEDDDDDDD